MKIPCVYLFHRTCIFGANSGSRTRTTSFNVGGISDPLNYLYSKSAFFRKGGARTHNLSLLGKCFTQRQPVRMLFFKTTFLIIGCLDWGRTSEIRRSKRRALPTWLRGKLLIRLFSSDNALWSRQF